MQCTSSVPLMLLNLLSVTVIAGCASPAPTPAMQTPVVAVLATDTSVPTSTLLPTSTLTLVPTMTTTATTTRTNTFATSAATPLPAETGTPTAVPKYVMVWKADFHDGLLKYTLDNSHPAPSGWFTGAAFTMTPGVDPHPWPEPIFNQNGQKIGDRSAATETLVVPDPLNQRGLVFRGRILKDTGVTEKSPDGSIQHVFRAHPSVIKPITGPFRIDLQVMIPNGDFVKQIQNTRQYSRWMSLLSFFTSENVFAASASMRILPDGTLTIGCYVQEHFDQDTVVSNPPFVLDKWNKVSLQVDKNRIVSLFLNDQLVGYAPLPQNQKLALYVAHGGLYTGPLPPGTTVYNDEIEISKME